MSPEKNLPSTMISHCCQLVRCDKSSRSLLPLARRGRPHHPSRTRVVLCKNCLKIKRRQESDILKIETSSSESNIFDAITDLTQTFDDETKHQMIGKDIPHEIEFSLMNKTDQIDYQSSEMLVWKMNTSDNDANQIHLTYDTGTLTGHEKKILLQQAIEKLQIVLNNRSTSTSIPDSDLDQIEFTYRALQTTVNILSSSLDSL